MAVYTQPFSIRVDFDVGRICKNQASITLKGAQAFRALQRRSYEAAREAWVLSGRPTVEHRVQVDYVICRGRVLDSDGAIHGLSHIRDALMVDAVTPFDSRTWIEDGKLIWETGAKWKGRESVVVVFRPLIEEPKPKVRTKTTTENQADQKALQARALKQALRGK